MNFPADEIARRRLAAHKLHPSAPSDARKMVEWMGAMQAQDFPMAKWAVGLRAGLGIEKIEAALERHEIVRTHVLRPTWHFVAAEDVRWMLRLTAPRIRASMVARDRDLGLDKKTYRKTTDIIQKSFADGLPKTRAELMLEIEKAGIDTTSDNRAAHLLMDAELEAVLCNGPMFGTKNSYFLMDEKVPRGHDFDGEEALHELAKRYFRSHGPASLLDFQWWSGLSVGEARRGLESVKSSLFSIKTSGNELFFEADSTFDVASKTAFFLPAFDEFLVAYRDRTASLDPFFGKGTITSNGIFKPLIVENGQVIGFWKREVKKGKVRIETTYFKAEKTLDFETENAAAHRFGDFLGLETEVKRTAF